MFIFTTSNTFILDFNIQDVDWVNFYLLFGGRNSKLPLRFSGSKTSDTVKKCTVLIHSQVTFY